jgi:predicted DCC family thiol-disulfide oxidoreductase YuxK
MPVRGERLKDNGNLPDSLWDRWILIWDGDCGFCRRWVERALRHDKSGSLTAIPYQECQGWLPDEVGQLSEQQAHLRSPDGRYWGGGDAAIRLMGLLGYRSVEAVLTLYPVRVLMGIGYRFAARNRARLSHWGL